MLDIDSDDAWFHDSIERYKELIMFDCGHPVHQIEPCDRNTVCALTENGSQKQTISTFTLPSKVTSPGCKPIQGCNDLKIKSGIFTPSDTTMIVSVYGNDKLLASQKKTKGIVLYNTNSDAEQIVYERILDFPLENPWIRLFQKDKVVLTTDSSKPVYIGDMNNEAVINKLTLDSETSDNITTACVDQSKVALTYKSSGTTCLYDHRIPHSTVVGIFPGDESCFTTWKVFTNYVFYNDLECFSTTLVYLLSKSGLFKLIDFRNLSKPVVNKQLPLSTKKDCFKISLKPGNESCFSVSGFDDSVYLFNTNDMTEVFKHDGHPRTEYCSKETYVTDHFWYTNEYIISSALNNSINCWVPNI